ncbi:MAG TPA: putative Ig domain-containing protein, partial [Steroidobacteraceae bacterium]|nr:putative Ig domain-containing protein [Steroidobacteraceae bacterium]
MAVSHARYEFSNSQCNPPAPRPLRSGTEGSSMHARAEIGRRLNVLVAIVAVNLLGIEAAHAQNIAPVIFGTPPTTATPGQAYLFQPTASDVNGDRISYGATGVPRWARFDRKSGRLYGMPTRRDLGKSSNVRISVSDGRLIASLPQFTLQVVAPATTSASNGQPWISGAPAGTAREKELYGFLPQAGDPDGDTLRFSIANKPSWATFTTSSGLLSGIPPAGSAGTYSNIVISVSDTQSIRSLPAFDIVVATAANSAPVIYGLPATSVQAGNWYEFRPTASDPDGQRLTFAIQNMPGWASFDTATGLLAGTPSNADANVYSNILISTSDGAAKSNLAPFSVTVVATNSLPSISGAPATSATVGQAYSFIPNASDPDGQTLTFAIVNKPS